MSKPRQEPPKWHEPPPSNLDAMRTPSLFSGIGAQCRERP